MREAKGYLLAAGSTDEMGSSKDSIDVDDVRGGVRRPLYPRRPKSAHTIMDRSKMSTNIVKVPSKARMACGVTRPSAHSSTMT